MRALAVRNVDRSSAPLLTIRQQVCLELGASGRTYKEIGVEMGISESGAKSLMSRAYARLGVESMIEAFLATGWLQPPQIEG